MNNPLMSVYRKIEHYNLRTLIQNMAFGGKETTIAQLMQWGIHNESILNDLIPTTTTTKTMEVKIPAHIEVNALKSSETSAPPDIGVDPSTGETHEEKVARMTRELMSTIASEKPAADNGVLLEEVKEIANQEARDVVAHELIPLAKDLSELKAFKEALKGDSKAAKRAPLVIAATSGDDPVLDALVPYYEAGKPNLVRTLLLSPPSFGKSYSIQKLGKTYDLYIEHGCSDDADENATLLGGVMPDGKGSFLINDGVLTQAVRAASKGQTVLLCLDEILRFSDSTMAFLLTFLQTRDNEYHLTTRNVVGGVLERLVCSADLLHIVGAANLGAIVPIDALWSRFSAKRLAFTIPFAEKVGSKILASFGIKDDGKSAKFAYAMSLSRKVRESGRANFSIDFRRLVAGCGIAPENPLKWVADQVADHCATWDTVSGDTVDDSLTALRDVSTALRT